MTDDGIDVLVAGAGPVGLTAALQLARSGVRVRLVDAASGPATTSRALGTHARSLEIYDQLGILGDIAPYGTRVNAFIRHHGDRPARVDFDFSGLPTRFPYMFNVDQVITERVLRGHAGAAGVDVEWDTRLESFEQDDEDVVAVLRHGDGYAETVRARYLWGCDGGRSTVRKALGLPLEGAPARTWLIADATVHTDLARDAAHVHSPASGQGMNTGIQDAVDLAWKLAMVVRGTAAPRLLGTYDAERVPIGKALLASTSEVMDNTTVETAERNTTEADRGFADALIQRMSGLRIAYPDSALTVPDDGAGGGPRPGERLTRIGAADALSTGWTELRRLLRDPAWHLIRFGEGSPDAAPPPSWIDTVTVGPGRSSGPGSVRDPEDRVRISLGASNGEWMIVRPDGYVSARGAGGDALGDALGRLADAGVGVREAAHA